jgi:uncharacterized protein (TIGR00255 family)
MTLVSMTGFAESTGTYESLRWRWEAKSVNGRSLDIRLRLPPGFEGLDSPGRTLAQERFKRGSLQIALTVEPQEIQRSLKIDAVMLASAVRIAQEIAAETGLAPARVDGLLALKGVIVQDEALMLDEAERAHRDAAILEDLAAALDALARARANEGSKLHALLDAQLSQIEMLTAQAAALAAAQPAGLRDRLAGQLEELLAANMLPQDRLAQEVALLVTRADVREELDRLRAHVQDGRALLAAGEAVGRKLDFLAQEFNRETNTLCSKSADIALTRTGLALKAVIDQFREQAQNVE